MDVLHQVRDGSALLHSGKCTRWIEIRICAVALGKRCGSSGLMLEKATILFIQQISCPGLFLQLDFHLLLLSFKLLVVLLNSIQFADNSLKLTVEYLHTLHLLLLL